MAKLMWIAGILLVAAGVALGLMIYFSPTSIISWGVTPDTAVILLVGGIIALGLGSVIDGLHLVAGARPVAAAAESTYVPAPIPEFGRRPAEAPIVPAIPAAANDTVSPQVKETIEALEQAKQELKQAFEEKAPEEIPAAIVTPEPAAEVVAEEAVAEEVAAEEVVVETEEVIIEEDVADDGQLYVVEERTIRNRPARILSDGTVEAETDEGWMRFENLEHLDEYLDAMAPAGKA